MAENKVFKGIYSDILTMSIEQIKSYLPNEIDRAATLTQIINSGGFLVNNWTPQIKKYAISQGRQLTDVEEKLEFGPKINVLTDFADQLSIEELHIILLHEEGHIQAGHLEAIADRCDREIEKIMEGNNTKTFSTPQEASDAVVRNFQENVNPEWEYMADDYALQYYSKNQVKSALLACLSVTFNFIEKIAKAKGVAYDASAAFRASISEPIMAARLKRLEVQ